MIYKDNFLSIDEYKNLKNKITSHETPWFYVENDTYPITENKNGYFINYFYKDQMPCHPYYQDCIPLLNKIGCVAPLEIRANLNLRDIDSKASGFHTDNNYMHVKTAVLFFTTCNAKTILRFKNNDITINSVENRILIFNSSVEHKLIYQTDKHKRYVLNINYYGDY